MFFYLGVMLGGAIIGLIPYFVGKKKGFKEMGLTGLAVCAVCALVQAWLSVLAAIIFVILINKKAKQ